MDLIRTSQAGQMLGVSSDTVRRYCDRGLLRCGRMPGGHRRVDRQSVIEYLGRIGLPDKQEPTPQLQPPTIQPSTSTEKSSVEQRLAQRLRGTR